MPDRVDRFFKNRVSATGHCILEIDEVLLPAILFFWVCGFPVLGVESHV